jgi:hypothetical protein
MRRRVGLPLPSPIRTGTFLVFAARPKRIDSDTKMGRPAGDALNSSNIKALWDVTVRCTDSDSLGWRCMQSKAKKMGSNA